MEQTLKSKAEQLQDTLLDGIRSGKYPVGGKMPSIRDLVKNHGVCKYTVEHVLNRLHESGYIHLEPRKAARVLRCPAKYRIQLRYLNSEVQNQSFWGDFYRGIHDEIKNFPDYEIFDIMGKKGERFVEAETFDGTLAMGESNITITDRNDKILKNHPLIYVYNHPKDGNYNCVSSDFSAAIDECISSMTSLGCRRITAVSWQTENGGVSKNKQELIKAAANKYNAEYGEINFIISPGSLEEIYLSCRELFTANHDGNGIVLLSDQFASPVLRAAHDCNIKIPDDLQIVGCDNLSDGAFYIPSLTTIELDRYEQGKAAVRMMIKCIENPENQNQQEFFPARVIYRESSIKNLK